MLVKRLHPWDVTYAEARRLQGQLSGQVVATGELPPDSLSLVAGADVSYSKATNRCYCGVVLLSFPELECVGAATAVVDATFPYIPGLLSFREIPGLVRVFEKLGEAPDLVLVDGQGLAHPRRMGLACHLGLILDVPTIGCAKSRLVGEYDPPASERGSRSALLLDGEIVGAVVRTRCKVSPVFVSVGHRIDLESAIQNVLACAPRFRLPETTRAAHSLVNELRLSEEDAQSA